MNIGERILQLRKEKNLSQEQLSEKLEISRQSISKWESGQSIPEADKIIQLSEIFNVTTDYLLKGKEVKKDNPAVTVEKSLPVVHGSSFYAILSTSINIVGLVLMITLWKAWRTELPVGIGLMIQIVGITVFEMASYWNKSVIGSGYGTAHLKYYSLNNWILLFMPVCYITTSSFKSQMPFTIFLLPLRFLLRSFGIPYFILCSIITCILMLILFMKKRRAIRSTAL